MNVTQLAVMRAILRHRGEPLTRVADDLAMDRTSLYRMLTSMRKRRWVSLKDGVDDRSQSASVAESGENVLRNADLKWANTQTEIIDRFGEAEWKRFVGELSRLIECANAVAAASQRAVDEP
jgi:DNA-binding MarR family transcriptional regulator